MCSGRDGAPRRGAGLLHSEIRGSKAACASPRLIAACHVLRRLLPPRHPPSAHPAWPPNFGHGGPNGPPDGLSPGRVSTRAFDRSLRPRALGRNSRRALRCPWRWPAVKAGHCRFFSSSLILFQGIRLPKSMAPSLAPKGARGRAMVGARGLEPRTSSLSETRSNQLSYAPRLPSRPRGRSPGREQCNPTCRTRRGCPRR